MVEISLKILVAFHEFIRSKLEIFDAIIVYISFSIDAAFLTSDDGISALGNFNLIWYLNSKFYNVFFNF